jgi:hypothetical protein
MIDFTNLPKRNKTYAGANGSKISVLYQGELYMLKFPAVPSINKNISYANGLVLQDFASLKNTIIDSLHNGYGTELSDIIETLDKQSAMDSNVLCNWFWNMFIVDAFIGNRDRHNGNWAFSIILLQMKYLWHLFMIAEVVCFHRLFCYKF